MKNHFGSRELVSCLLCLGFTKKRSTGSSHEKYSCPKRAKLPLRPFIIVISGRRIYDPHTMSSYLRQIQNLGYSIEEINTCFNK